MKNLTLIAVLIFGLNIQAQNACCKIQASTETFAMLGNNNRFVSAHLDPKPFVLDQPMGKDLQIVSQDGKDAHIYEIKNAKAVKDYVFVIHEWWGMNDYIKQESEKIFNTLGNVNVIAIDLYDGKIATNKDSAGKYMQSVNSQRAENIIKSVLSYVGKDAKIASIGWCFGGGWSMQSALLAAKQSKACVMYYGMPEEKMDKIKSLNSPVLFIWPTQDQWINKDVVSKFEANMKTAQKTLTVKSYNANHAFANPSNPIFNKEFAEDAFNKAIQFIKTNLK